MIVSDSGSIIMGKIMVGVGIMLILLGGLWILQGVGIIGGSMMSGQSFWANVGVIVLAAGIVLGALGLRRRPTAPSI